VLSRHLLCRQADQKISEIAINLVVYVNYCVLKDGTYRCFDSAIVLNSHPTLLSIYFENINGNNWEDRAMKYLLSLILLLTTAGTCIGDIDCPPGEVYYTNSAPEGWNVVGVGCCGIFASDSTNPARGIIALNRLHQGFNMLPAINYWKKTNFTRFLDSALLRLIWRIICHRISVWEIVR
jgi:hypothetical protein